MAGGDEKNEPGKDLPIDLTAFEQPFFVRKYPPVC